MVKIEGDYTAVGLVEKDNNDWGEFGISVQ